MFNKEVYKNRRNKLRELLSDGIVLILGNSNAPMNYAGNIYKFRQDSNFLYFFGQDKPGFTGLIDVDEDKDYIFGEDFTIGDIIWMGPQPSVKELAATAGVTNTGSPGQLSGMIDHSVAKGQRIHFLPFYRAENAIQTSKLLGISLDGLKKYASKELIKAVVALRSIKSDAEINEIEKALAISYETYTAAMKMIKPGMYEREIVGKMEGIVGSYGSHYSFPTILSINGETLHNHYHGNKIKEKDLLLIDSGAESPEYYASDITRTFPVGGTFTPEQKDIYQVVLDSQYASIEAIKPGKTFKEIHLQVATVIANGLKDMGLMKGNIEDAVKQGAHALFFPHGLGHMIGLDVHDMEDLGENNVGYDETVQRSDQFGLAYLRMARELEPGFVVTVEPGTYFIPALIDQWKAENKLADFIDYDAVEKFKGFGGIRIEDDVAVTENGNKVLGKGIPKDVADIEKIMA